ncbi:MAG: hypothetical protein WAV13_01075 [Thermodesulfovibrionales bacterium]
MKELIFVGIFILLAGCAPVLSGEQTAESTVQGWSNPQKTDLQQSQDLGECQTRCSAA